MSFFSIIPEPGGFFAGAFSGACGVIVSQPFDMIKVRLQNSGGSDLAVVKHIIKYEGFFSLWRGSSLALIGTCFGNSISFGVVENCKSQMMKGRTEALSPYENALCGAYSGIATSFIVSPTEGIRIMLQTQERSDYKNTRNCVKELFKKNGIFGVYRGFSMTLLRDVIGDAFYFMTYQLFPRVVFGGTENTENRHFGVIMLSGGVSGIAFWTTVYPIDTLKSRVQADSVFDPKYKGGLDCFIKTVKNEGFWQLYNGYFMCILRAFPLNVALFFGFELAMSILGRDY